jgi:uncharacterized membrane protein YdjX (TVP38/TMEM64 family)
MAVKNFKVGTHDKLFYSYVNNKNLKYVGIWTIIGAAIIAGLLLTNIVIESPLLETAQIQLPIEFSVEGITDFVKSMGAWGIAASIGLMILHSFIPFPAEFVAIANGMIFGSFWGVVITWVGAMIGAFLAFWLSRKLGRPFVKRMLSEDKARLVDNLAAQYGAGALFLSRFLPVIAFNLINYAAGLMKISWWTFAWATGLGILPMTILMVVVGDQVGSIPWQLWLILLLIGFLLWLLAHHFFYPIEKRKSDN